MNENLAIAIRQNFCPLCEKRSRFLLMNDVDTCEKIMREAEIICANLGLSQEEFIQLGEAYLSGRISMNSSIMSDFRRFMDA
jgi:hypothetical protein